MARSETGSRPLFPLYAILDAEAASRAGWTLIDLASACLAGGARFLQLRAKGASGAWLLATAIAIREMAREAGALLIVNDRADIARLSGADGVHLGQDDVTPGAARALVGGDAMVGLSTHTRGQLTGAVALTGLTYVACGPVFDTTTKTTAYERGGLDLVRRAAAATRARALPLVAIGGITLDTAAQVVEAGAASVAVIGDLLSTGDPEARVRDYLRRV